MLKSIHQIENFAFWQQIQWVLDPVSYMQSAVRQYPDIFAADIFNSGQPVIFVHEPKAIQELLTSDRKQFSTPGELNGILSPLIGDFSVITLSGDRHKKRRQMVMPAFHGARMQNYGQLIADLTLKRFSQIAPQQTFITRDVVQEISLQIILQAVFGLYEGDRLTRLQKLVTEMTHQFNTPLTSALLFFPALRWNLGKSSPWNVFLDRKRQIDEIIYAEIHDRRAHLDPERTDILHMLLMAIDEEGNHLSDLELRDELMALLLAGHETTATAISWALYLVHRHPEVYEQLQQELTPHRDTKDWMEIYKLPYLTAVCNETLRLHPVAMLTFPRFAETATQLGEYQVKAANVILGCIYLLHQREDLYPAPQQFRPERFLEKQYSPYEFMPFGGGSRRCMGEALAQFELRIVLATILNHFPLQLLETKPVIPKRRGVTLAPAGGIKMQRQ
ncbi:MAG: cytochrome P450 [Pseudanabaenaceae cyanobacterium bins.39]|nr:cytochrome P450 [Pseudanabaenaceae cyanobacterium bins.39]